MALTQLESYMVNSSGSYTVSTLSATAGITAAGTSVTPVKIASVQSATSGYVSDSATAVSTSGGYLIITGSGFQSSCQVLIGSTYAAATTFVNSTTLNVQVNATSSGTYPVYVVNTDGSVGIKVPGIVFDAYPVWSTGATLPQQVVNVAISISLSATDSNSLTYSVTQGSTLPSGLSLSSGGLLSGTITGITSQTTYSFSIDAVDSTYNEKTARTFSVIVVVGDPYFNLTTLLLNGEGTAATNGATNNTFLDTSLSGLTITRNGTPTQGTFTPYSQNGWSMYLNGTSAISFSAITTTGSFTCECWYYRQADPASYSIIFSGTDVVSANTALNTQLSVTNAGAITMVLNATSICSSSSGIVATGQWTHIVYVRSGSSCAIFANGTRVATGTTSASVNVAAIGGGLTAGGGLYASGYAAIGYISNARVTTTAVYDPTLTTLTVPTTSLTAVTGTSLLTCQNNRFVDNSGSSVALTIVGTPQIQAFAPLNSAIAYSTSAVGGSMYYNGSTDFLSTTGVPVPQTGQFTIEAWIYTQASAIQMIYTQYITSDGNRWTFLIDSNSGYKLSFAHGTAASVIGTTVVPLNQWNHVAVTRDASNTLRMFLNGAVDASQSSYTSSLYQGGTRIGFWNNSQTYYFNGYISNLRVVNGTAIYTSTFTVPSTPLTAISNTSLLLTGTNSGIIDQSGRNNLITVGANISTSVYKYGTGSMSFSGSGQYLQRISPPATLYAWSPGSYTIEYWIYANAFTQGGNVGGDPVIVGNMSATGTGNYWSFGPISNGTVKFYYYSGSIQAFATTSTLSTGQWYHLAFVNNAGALAIYINGVSSATSTISGTPVTGSDIPFTIGSANNASFNGYIDDLRITKGYARYTANFSPPSTQLLGQ